MSLQLAISKKPTDFSDSVAVGKDSEQISSEVFELKRNQFAENVFRQNQNSSESIEEKLYEARAKCKVKISQIAMHLKDDWRLGLYKQLDSLMDFENWDEDDLPISLESFSTFLRAMTYMKPEMRPGLGVSVDGNLIGAWTEGKSRLTVEFKKNDKVRWVLSQYIDDERESAAGETDSRRLKSNLSPYSPEQWFGV